MLNQFPLEDPAFDPPIDDREAYWQGYYECLINSRYSSLEYWAIAGMAVTTFVLGFLLGARWHG